MEHIYHVDLTWEKERIGKISSSELDLSFEVATPPQFPKGVERIWSPEHLFVASINACFMTTFLAIAENFKLKFEKFDCKSEGKLGLIEGKYQMTEIILKPIVIANSESNDKIEKILEKTKNACLISNSIKSSILMRPQINEMVN